MKYQTKLYLIVFCLTLVILSILAYQYAVISPYRISSDDARERIQSGTIDMILDVRTRSERSSLGFYPGSIHIQSADLEKDMSLFYPDTSLRILVYCNTGHRARLATDTLHALGYRNAVYISSGYWSLMK